MARRPRPPRPRKKNAAAVALARARWAGVPAVERRKGAQKAIKTRWDRYRAAQAAKRERTE
jgi:hypothetical protein